MQKWIKFVRQIKLDTLFVEVKMESELVNINDY